MGDFCCPIEFICVHYVTFSKSPLRVILCLLSQRKNYGKILKTKEFLTEKRGNQKMGSERESIFKFKMDSSTLSNYFFTTNRHSQYYKTWDFTTSTVRSTRKCLSCSGFCKPISAILRMLNSCAVLVARKLLQSFTNEPDELKL